MCIASVDRDNLHVHGCSLQTVGQYLQPIRGHLPVERFVEPRMFEEFRRIEEEIGFANVASGSLVRSSYHAGRRGRPRSPEVA